MSYRPPISKATFAKHTALNNNSAVLYRTKLALFSAIVFLVFIIIHMALTSSPFNAVTGDLLPGYRDAYLRGDLSTRNTALVDAYLKAHPTTGHEMHHRFHTLRQTGHAVRPVGWLHQQFELMRTQPARFRQRAAGLVLVAGLLSGAVFANTSLPVTSAGGLPATVASELTVMRTKTVSGQILDEKGRPLAGATVLDKMSGRGTGTDAQGRYALTVPANHAAQLQFGYGGYQEKELSATEASYDVTLHPTAKKAKRHWWSF